jgi:hypothetical protein
VGLRVPPAERVLLIDVISDPPNVTLTSPGPTQVSVIHQHRFPVLPDDDMASVMESDWSVILYTYFEPCLFAAIFVLMFYRGAYRHVRTEGCHQLSDLYNSFLHVYYYHDVYARNRCIWLARVPFYHMKDGGVGKMA